MIRIIKREKLEDWWKAAETAGDKPDLVLFTISPWDWTRQMSRDTVRQKLTMCPLPPPNFEAKYPCCQWNVANINIAHHTPCLCSWRPSTCSNVCIPYMKALSTLQRQVHGSVFLTVTRFASTPSKWHERRHSTIKLSDTQLQRTCIAELICGSVSTS
jgi:hypothetical protein